MIADHWKSLYYLYDHWNTKPLELTDAPIKAKNKPTATPFTIEFTTNLKLFQKDSSGSVALYASRILRAAKLGVVLVVTFSFLLFYFLNSVMLGVVIVTLSLLLLLLLLLLWKKKDFEEILK